ncbi:hypothetical protein OG984_09680 [Nocardioides sp. NBC_00368]|uniref:hypothetical protein n=1 Tax=Nocardioides sp. NBC_00368 TaxID=2976000 RepID=UPI002E1CB5C3
MSLDLTLCPDCGAPAEVEWRAVMESTDGPVEHARVRCLRGHWYLLPVASLAGPGCRLAQSPTSFRE